MKEQAIYIVKKLQEAGFQAVFAGGCVRDQLLNLEPHDYDVATSALPDEVERLFEKTIPIGKAFGVINVLYDGYEFQVATFRNDGEYSDNRRPSTVEFCSMEEDAKRRDLTINGLFYDPIANKLYDFVEGQKDLEDHRVRLIGDASKRIEEDYLRMLRVIRFATRFDWDVDSETINAVSEYASMISQVSVERIFDEIVKIFQARNFKYAFDLLFETKLIDYILPEVKAMKGCEQPREFHPEGDVLKHVELALYELPSDASKELLIGTLFHDVGKPRTQTFEDRIRFSNHDNVGAAVTREILTRFKCSNEFIDHVEALVANHMKFMVVKEMRVSRLKRFMRLPKFDEHMMLHYADCMSSHENLDNYEFVKEQLSKVEFEPERLKPIRIVTGHDLIDLGFKQGPIFKQILVSIEDAQLEGKITTREEALKFISEMWVVEKFVEPSVEEK